VIATALVFVSSLAQAEPDVSPPPPEEQPVVPAPPPPPPPEPEPEPEPPRPPRMSEGRRIVVAYNTGFHWSIAPGIVFADSKTAFYLGLRFGYGVDTGSVILVPGILGAGYFTDPSVFTGVPLLRLVYPIDRFAPFVEGGAGIGHVSADTRGDNQKSSKDGLAVLVGAGFMIHFVPAFGLGVEGSWQAITGTDFHAFGVGPVLAIGF
jgi:hypothetical protein